MSGTRHPSNCECDWCNAPMKFDTVTDAVEYVEYLEVEREMIQKTRLKMPDRGLGKN